MNAAAAGDIRPRSSEGPAPLSFGQELLWLVDRASPGVTAWNVPRAFRVGGALDAVALQRAFDALASRHAILRTVFEATADGPRQVVRPATGVPIRHVDLRGLRAAERDAEAERIVNEEDAAPFDLTRDEPLRVVLIELGENDRILCITTHHIVSDGWSKGVMFRELSALYDAFRRGAEPDVAPLPIQFADYAAWERSEPHQAELADSLAYWRAQLADLPPALDLPTDLPRPRVQGFDARRVVHVLPPALVDGMACRAREHDVTQYMLLLAAYATLLHRYSGAEDVVIGSPIAGRAQSETDGLIGYFANTMVLRARLDGDPAFVDVLARVRDTALDAYDHQDVPVEQLVLELQKDRRLSFAPLFNVVLTMEDVFDDELRFGDAVLQPIDRDHGPTKFDLTLLVRAQPAGLQLSLLYRTDLFAHATAQRMLLHLERLLEAIVADPGRRISALPMLSADEMRAAAAGGPAPQAPAGLRAVFDQIAAIADTAPGADALACDGQTLTYRELIAQARELGGRLGARGIGTGAIVGLAAERSIDAIAGMLGIMASGAAYAPLDVAQPPARLAAQLREAGIDVVVATAAGRSGLPPCDADVIVVGESDGARAAAGRQTPAGLDDVAYVIFTSGSTGVPKGVAVTHRNLAAYTAAICERLELGDERGLQFATVSSPAADLGHTAIFPALCTRGTLHLVPPAVTTQPAAFAEWASAHPIDVLKITPSHVSALLESGGEAVLPQRWLVVGGEPCSWELAERVRRAGRCRMLNHYGPTETTVGACTFEAGSRTRDALGSATVPIGVPLRGVRAYVLGTHGELLPDGIPGELYVGGVGVARGYVNRPELTAERFVADPYAGDAAARMYRTGDRVRRLRGGELEFLGRFDGQIKVRGFRVELGEIEAALADDPRVAHAAVVHREDDLVAYAVLRDGARDPASADALRGVLAERLPEYMVPSAVVLLERLPLTANGKLDRAALPAPRDAAADAYVAPRTPTESTIATIWADVLKSPPLSVTANFVALGFHSILAIRALGTLSKTLRIRIPLRTFFDAPTIEQLGAIVDAELAKAAQRELEAALALAEGLSDDDLARLPAGGAEGGP